MDSHKPILGLKTKALPVLDSNEEEDEDIFISSDDEGEAGLPLTITITPQTKPSDTNTLVPPPPPPPTPKKHEGMINSFDDASQLITPILAGLDVYDFNQSSVPFSGDIYYVPEHIASDSMSKDLNQYAKSVDQVHPISAPRDSHVNILAQIDIVKYYKKAKVDFSTYQIKSLDSRIASLVYFILSKTDDLHISSYYLIMCIAEFLKSPSVAPVASLFPDFKFQDIIHHLCSNLVTLFPHHPLLPSLIDKFAKVDPTAPQLLTQIVSEDDETDSDSFFESLKSMQNRAPVILLPGQSSTLSNILETCQTTANDPVTITVNEPPSTMTYSLPNGASQLPPQPFVSWIESITPKVDSQVLKQLHNSAVAIKRNDIEVDANIESVKSQPGLPQIALQTSGDETDPQMLLLNMIKDHPDNHDDPIPDLKDCPELFHLQYPLLQSTNQNPKKCAYPELIKWEYKLHDELMNLSHENEKVDDILKSVSKQVNLEGVLKFKSTEIKRLSKLRDIKEVSSASSEDILTMLYLSDIEFVLDGRSPLTLKRCGRQTPFSVSLQAFDRAGILYYFYSTKVYPPYVTYRIAFALAVNLHENMPSVSADLIFEGIFILLNCLPTMSTFDSTRNGLLFFAELLEKLDRYYYSSLLIDAFYRNNPSDASQLTTIASFCQRNHDAARCAFYYTQALQSLVKRNQVDEALYIAQLLAQIYMDYGLYSSAISLLVQILKNSYNINIKDANFEIKSSPSKNGMPTKIVKSEFYPKPESINTLLTGISLCDSLSKLGYYKLEDKLLTEMANSTENQLFNKLINYLRTKLYLCHNEFDHFIDRITNLSIVVRRGPAGNRFSLYSASSFDTSLAILRLLVKSYIQRRMFSHAVFWSEVFISAQTNQYLRDIGYGYLQRGLALKEACSQMHMTAPPYSLHVKKLLPTMEAVASYVKDRQFKNLAELTSETASSFKAAHICLEKVGCVILTTYSSLYYIDTLLYYFVDSLFDKDITNISTNEANDINLGKDTDSDSMQFSDSEDNNQPAPLVISEPQLEIEDKGIPPTKQISFSPITLDNSSVIDEVSNLFRRIDQTVVRNMNPVMIIYSQILKAKLNYLQHKCSTAETLFDYAYNNISTYFACAGEFIPRHLSIKTLRIFQNILDNMCVLLLFFSSEFINDRLTVFDWRNDVQSKIQDKLRIFTKDNETEIIGNFDISSESIDAMSSMKFPKLQKDELAPDDNETQKNRTVESIEFCLKKINTNTKLFEAQKIPEDEMHNNNHYWCRQIKFAADQYRRENESKIPIDYHYSYCFKTIPNIRSLVFVQHIKEYIYIYVPNTGRKRRVLLVPSTEPSSFTVNSKKEDFQVPTSSEIFPADFLSVISLYLMCDKKMHHENYNPTNAQELIKQVSDLLFGNIIDAKSLPMWTKVKDDHFAGESKFGKGSKGHLSTIQTSSPTIFLTSTDLRPLPFELMFPNCLILRSWSYSHAILKPKSNNLPFPHLIVCRWLGEAAHLMQNAVARSREVIREFVEACGGCFPLPYYVNGNERNVCFPFPLFSSNKDNEYYKQKYSFCDFIDVDPTHYPKFESALFFFTYSDMCEMPRMLEKLVSSYPFSFFMFIPAQFVREAFKLMINVFERHEKRAVYVEKNQMRQCNDKSIVLHSILLGVPFDFLTCLQTTLIDHLKCPISLITPTF